MYILRILLFSDLTTGGVKKKYGSHIIFFEYQGVQTKPAFSSDNFFYTKTTGKKCMLTIYILIMNGSIAT